MILVFKVTLLMTVAISTMYNTYILICIGTVTLSPSGITPMCNGDQLELTCNITLGSTVEWSTFGIPEGGMTPV